MTITLFNSYLGAPIIYHPIMDLKIDLPLRGNKIRRKRRRTIIACRAFHITKRIQKDLDTRAITRLLSKKSNKKLLGAVDIETVKYGARLYPYAVGVAYTMGAVVEIQTFYLKPRSVDYRDLSSRSTDLITTVGSYIREYLSGYTLYAHNLGKFDGYLMLKPFLQCFGPYKLMKYYILSNYLY